MELAAIGVRRRAGRAVLTVAAVALAAALLTALLSIAGTARSRVLNQLSKGGPLAGIKVAAAAPDPSQLDRDNARPGRPRAMDDDALARIQGVPGVSRVIPIVTAQVAILLPDPPADGATLAQLRSEGGTTTTTERPLGRRDGNDRHLRPVFDTLVGIPVDRAGQLPVTLLAGRLPAPGSLTEVAVTQGYLERVQLKRQEAGAVLGTEVVMGAARVVRLGDGTQLRGRWTKALIVGVVAQEAASGQLLAPIEAARAQRDWTNSSEAGDDRVDTNRSPYAGAFVIASGLDRVSAVRAGITDVGYATTAPENLIASVQRYLRVVEIVLSAVGLIALCIAALGISNALLAAIRERRREIGVLKAIGARDRDVMRVFLLEAGVLGFAGGSIGTLAGYGIAKTVAEVVNGYLRAQGLAGVQLPLPLGLLLGAMAGSTVLALLAGALPARRAARLPAREAVAA
jgi:hypothetical protein